MLAVLLCKRNSVQLTVIVLVDRYTVVCVLGFWVCCGGGGFGAQRGGVWRLDAGAVSLTVLGTSLQAEEDPGAGAGVRWRRLEIGWWTFP